MPYLKCVACRLRLQAPGHAIGGVGELCPGCGGLLEPVIELSELVGLQAFRGDPGEIERDSFFPEAVAQALPPPEPD